MRQTALTPFSNAPFAHTRQATIAMHESVFSGNHAVGRGGAMAVESARPMAVANTTFSANTLAITLRAVADRVAALGAASAAGVRGDGGGVGGADGAGMGGAGVAVGSDPAFTGAAFAASVMNNVSFVGNMVQHASVGVVADAGAGASDIGGAAVSGGASSNITNKTVMAWIADIASDDEYVQVAAWVVANSNAVNAVADTTLYSITANGTLVKNLHNIERHAVWQQHSIRTSPCIYGKTPLATMRLIWSNPASFIETLLADAQQFGYEGLNLDWEAFGTVL
jgi:hypothetical protein